MKKLFALVMILGFITCVYSQNKTIDSLSVLLKNAKEDTNKVHILYQISEASEDYRNGLKYAREALLLAVKLNFRRGIADAYNNIGYAYSQLGEEKKAIEYHHKSMEIRKSIGDMKGLAESYINLAAADYVASDFQKAIENYEKSLQLLEKTNENSLKASCLSNLGLIYEHYGNYELALDCFFKSLKLNEGDGKESKTAYCLLNIGSVYYSQNDYYNALAYSKKALAICEKNNDFQIIVTALNNIGVLYYKQGDTIAALKTYQKSFEICRQTEDKDNASTLLNNIGSIYFHQNNFEKSRQYFSESLKIQEEIGGHGHISTILINLGKIDLKENRNNKAEEKGVRALKIANSIGSPVKIRDASEFLSNVYSSKSMFKEALNMYVLFKQMSDSVSSNEMKKSTLKKMMKFDFEKKEASTKARHEKEQALANASIKRQELIQNATLGGVAIVGVFSFMLVRVTNRKKKTTFEKQVAEVETKALRSQMNPHFIYNSLNSIDDYILNNDIKNSSLYVNKFSRLMRLILESSRKEEVSLKEDLESLELYIQLENLRMLNKVECSIDVSSEINSENVLIPPMLLQPFIENSFKHAFHGIDAPKLEIKISMKDETLYCTVTDNGKGRENVQKVETETKEKRQSLGMTVTRERLDIISKIKKSKAYFTFEDLMDNQQKAAGTRVMLSVPASFAF